MKSKSLKVGVILAIALVLTCAAWGQTDLGNPVGHVSSQENPEFWRSRRDGWFWYRSVPAPTPEEKFAEQVPPSSGKASQNKDIEEFENFQYRLENLRKIAIINPTPENVRVYMMYERMAFKQATVFAEMQQALNWVDPIFAEDSAELRPVNPIAMRVWDQQRADTKREFLSRLAKTHGLYFFIRGDCPYCHAFAPLIKRFGEQTGISVFPVTLDGGGNREYPKPIYDNGIAARLGIKMVPALVLAQPSLREYQVVSFGMVSEEEIMDRIYSLMSERRIANARQP
jgi:conjugal transfer pilus assembly protein TraF